MLKVERFLLVLFLLLLVACNAEKKPIQAIQIPITGSTSLAVVASTATETVPSAPTATETLTPTPTSTETAVPTSAIPAFLTSIPGIAETLTAAYSTPGAQETLAAQQTMLAATEGGLSGPLLSQCPNPSDPPMQAWVNIPVMPQATAGQVVQTLIGSYYCFRTPVTAQDVESFYKEKLTVPNWVMQSDANGTMIFVGLGPSGAQFLVLASGPGNQNDLIVAINVTNPMMMPTPKP